MVCHYRISIINYYKAVKNKAQRCQDGAQISLAHNLRFTCANPMWLPRNSSALALDLGVAVFGFRSSIFRLPSENRLYSVHKRESNAILHPGCGDSMIPILRTAAKLRPSVALRLRCYSSITAVSSVRAVANRGIDTFTNHERIHPPIVSLSSRPFLSSYLLRSSLFRHPFSTSLKYKAVSFRDLKSEDAAKEKPKPKEEASQGGEPELDPAELAYQAATKKSREKARQEWERLKAEEEDAEQEKKRGKDDAEDQRQERRKEEKKNDEPPPPPHGMKSPWQVFRDTLQTEFKASKEWNESTKQLASSANAFTQNESVKRAREAYTAASGAATSGTASAFKTTGKAIGQSAAWTWDSAAVKGLREGVNAAGRGLDKATKPIRDTEAFKSVQNVVDDGSSSRYGGWIEKEERKKRRELREQEETVPGGKRAEKAEEDPK